MKILVLNYEFPPVGGGGGQVSADLCQALAANGHALRVLTTRVSGLPKREAKDGYEILRVFTGRRSLYRASFPVMLGYLAGSFLPGLRMIKRWKPDVIHAHFAVPTGALAYVLHRLTGVPYVLTAHLGDVPGGVPQKTDRWFRIIYPMTHRIWHDARAVVAVSAHTRSLAEKHYHVPIKVIPNGVSLLERNEGDLDVGDPPRLIFAGRFQPQKNLPFLINALSEIRGLAWEMTFLGDGPQRPAVEERIRDLNLEDRIRLEGWVTSNEVWQRLGKSDLLVMPSLSEGLPVVGVQALANGVAIVGTHAGGLAEIIEDGLNGRLCEVGDNKCFINGLRWCLEDHARLRVLKQSSLEIAKRYDIRYIAERYENILNEAALR